MHLTLGTYRHCGGAWESTAVDQTGAFVCCWVHHCACMAGYAVSGHCTGFVIAEGTNVLFSQVCNL